MNFVSHQQFREDLAKWERQLPEFDAVCGVPRSGLIPAAYIALRRNIPHLHLGDLYEGAQTAFERSPLRRINPAVNKPRGSKILIVDDSTSVPGHTLLQIRERLKSVEGEFSFGAVYREPGGKAADHVFKDMLKPRMFEWNWFRHYYLRTAILDIDGVLCEDWTHRSEVNHDPEFEQHMENAKPLWLPQIPVLGLATSRIERYRPQTEAWLARHGVQYKFLYMHPAATPEARRAANDHAKRKSDAYRLHPRAMLFIESADKQAQQIHAATRRPVLCTDTMKMYA
jgi:uncharacterized HAD superfamily protein/adenine/guanine phosphoribosyltransferase-like PRPP-binding protein